MFIFKEPKDLVRDIFSLYTYCKGLNDDFKRYKCHAKRLYESAKKIDNAYGLSDKSYLYRPDPLPNGITRFYEYTQKFRNHVYYIENKSKISRFFFLHKSNDKMKKVRMIIII